MGQPQTVGAPVAPPDDLARLLGLPFKDSDDVIRAAIAEASVPALLMAMVHMTGNISLLDELPKPFKLIALDVQGGMSEADKETVRTRAFEVVRDYRDRGCPPPFVPDARQLRTMLDVISGGQVTEEFVDYIAADLRLSDADQRGPVLASTPQQRAGFPVVVIGCGEAGLLAGIKLKQAGVPFTIIEKQSGVGGTWLANRYPGCRVDIANHYYAYSFEPTDHWSHFYSEQPEILQYLNEVMDRHEIAPHVRFDTEVVGATWDEEGANWRVEIWGPNGTRETLAARALICAVGQFSNSVIPDIKGGKDFQGPSFHTAHWDDTVDVTGKRVAVIGAGASGFQLVPAIAPITERVDVYQRTAQWMAPNVHYHAPIGEGAKWAVRHLPYYGRWLRFVLWWPIADGAADLVVIDPDWDNGGLSCGPANHQVREVFIAWMRAFTDDEELLAKVIPNYPPMGKRTLQDNGTWLMTLQRDDVELVRDAIAEITPGGVTTVDGVHRPADVLIWATGFDVNHQLGPINVRGLGGRGLSEAWGDAPYAYLGITVPGFPNFYCMYGPGTNAVNGVSIIYNSECQMRYILGCIDMVLANGVGSAVPRRAVCDDYNRRSQQRLKTMVYTHPAVASSYYKNSRGDVPTLFAWRILDYWNWTNSPNPDDYEFRPRFDRRNEVAERLAGKVALVSGGARGMGASHVRTMVAEGAKVVFGDILDDEGKAVAAELGDEARYVHLDVTKPEDWEAAVATAISEYGGIDVLVNNAGIINVGMIEDYALSEWQRILDINLTGVFLGIRAVVKPMKEAGRGSIINISSIEGMAGTLGCHGYTASKFGVRGLTKSVAMELGPSGIRVNSIHPGLIKTPMTEWVPEDIFQTALGRIAQPKEVSNLVVYLASDDSSYSTGSEFVVDGGTTAGLAHKDFSAVDTEQQPEWVT